MTRRTVCRVVALLAVMAAGCSGDVAEKLEDAASEPRDGGELDAAADAGMVEARVADGSRVVDGGDLRDQGVDQSSASPDGAPASRACAGTCHGRSSGNAAPPLSLRGLTASSDPGVGAHQEHLGPSSWHAEVACAACHKVPQAVGDPGHIDSTAPAEVIFSQPANSGGLTSHWDGAACQTYCHGASLSGGLATSPVWTQVDGSQKRCGACHGVPPPTKPSGEPHSQSTDCSLCHGAVMAGDGTFAHPELHINGTIEAEAVHDSEWYVFPSGGTHRAGFLSNPSSCSEARCHGTDLLGAGGPSCSKCHSGWNTDCTFCHGGTDNDSGAPPVGVSGDAAAIGAHTAHVTQDNHPAYSCDVCHPARADARDEGHIDGFPAEVELHGLAAGATYDYATKRCSNVYCHGPSTGVVGEATWNETLSGGCRACHDDGFSGEPTTLGGTHWRHIHRVPCYNCHDLVLDAANHRNTIVQPSLHADGFVTAPFQSEQFKGDATWDPVNKTCTSPFCHWHWGHIDLTARPWYPPE